MTHLAPKFKCNLTWSRPGAVVMDGKMYVAGGRDPVGHADLDTMEVFDDVTQKWYLMPSRLSSGRTGFQLLAVRGKLYAMGGWSDHRFLETVEEYDPIPDLWRPRANMTAGPRWVPPSSRRHLRRLP